MQILPPPEVVDSTPGPKEAPAKVEAAWVSINTQGSSEAGEAVGCGRVVGAGVAVGAGGLICPITVVWVGVAGPLGEALHAESSTASTSTEAANTI